VRNDGEQPVRGTLYFQAPERVLIRVSEPTLQWSEFSGHTLLIYYPAEQRAFRFISRNRLLIPFARSFLGFLRPDFGLAGRHSRRQGELGLGPPRSLRRAIGQAVSADRGEPVFLQLTTPGPVAHPHRIQPGLPGRRLPRPGVEATAKSHEESQSPGQRPCRRKQRASTFRKGSRSRAAW
jgi:hypothetical protein